MLRTLALPALVLVVLGAWCDSAEAQVRPRRYSSSIYSRPTVSPYLNLLRRDNNRSDPALDYFTLVRPEREFRARLDAQARSLERLQGDVEFNEQSLQDQGVRPTGHTSYFLNYGKFYPGFSRSRRSR